VQRTELPVRVGVEVGGTFTDLILIDEAGAVAATAKVLSTPGDPAGGVLDALRRLDALQLDNLPLVHGSTVATNAVLERNGAQVGLLVTAGFRDLLELQRQDRETIYDIHYQKPQPLAQPDLVGEIVERVDAKGTIISDLDEASVRQAVSELIECGATSFAVCLLHSYRNPAHERRVAELIGELVPDFNVSLSSDVVAEFREYERASTTTIDAFVKPVVDRYLRRLEAEATERGISEVWMMQSNGGLLPAGYVRRHPARTLFSGPAAGVTGAVRLAQAAGLTDIITMDMGGTSTDVCLVTGGRPEITTEAKIDRLPIRIPMLDIVSVGAGGGSIVWIDSGGMLQVGPRSAGGEPGPACYGRGGVQPTATDANVVRGLIRPGHFLSGQLELDEAAAEWALQPVAAQTDRTAQLLSEDVYRIANAAMANAIRLVSTERGYDPRGYALVAYGGAGPLHAAAVAEELSIGRVLVPPYPGLISAYGLLAGDFKRDFARTAVQLLADALAGDVTDAFATLRAEALTEVASQGIDASAAELSYGLDMRYRGQGFELTVPVDASELAATNELERLANAFHELHRVRYGHATPGEPLELVTYRLSVRVPSAKPAGLRTAAATSRPPEVQSILIDGQPTPCAFLWRGALAPAYCAAGPLVVEEETATTYVPPGWRLSVDSQSNLLLERVEAA
jgi:N-methylhydantoinase A